MEENYIHIYCTYIAELAEHGSFDTNDFWFMVEAFKPVCEHMNTRNELIAFLQQYTADYPELLPLVEHLRDSNYKFI